MPRLLLALFVAHCAFAAESDVRAAASRSVRLLQNTMRQWKQDCVSCHHQTVPVMALAAARQHGVPVDEGAAQAASNDIFGKLYSSVDKAVQYPMVIDPGIVDGHELVAANAAGVAPSLTTKIVARRLARWQTKEGNWQLLDSRPPQAESLVTATALAVRAVSLYAPSPQPTIDRARKWLLANKPRSTEEHTYRLLGLLWTGASEAERKAAATQLVSLQNTDGGWGQLPRLPSDAYSTAQSAYALKLAAGHSASKAIEYLLRTQKPDGSWLVETRIHTPAPISPPMFESGFPYGRNQFLSCAATAWGVMALSVLLPPSPHRPRPVPAATPKDVRPWMEMLADPKAVTAGGTTALMLAAHDPALVKALLERGADAKARTKAGFDALTAAAQYPGNAETLRLLLSNGAVANPSTTSASPLLLTSMHGDAAMVELLLKHGASHGQQSMILGLFPARPLEVAANFQNEAAMRVLARHGAKVDSLDSVDMTPLSWAALSHKDTSLRVLLELGANPNHSDKLKLTPLQHTTGVRHASPNTAALLRAAGAK